MYLRLIAHYANREKELNIVKNIKNNARDVLINESPPIQNQATLINESFKACVKEIYSVKGSIVVTGIGKSSKIANKIVGMLNSTVTPKRYLCVNYLHLLLATTQPEDMVRWISRAGNTPALKLLFPIFKRSGSKLVASAGNSNSCVARQGDFVPYATIADEGSRRPHALLRITSWSLPYWHYTIFYAAFLPSIINGQLFASNFT